MDHLYGDRTLANGGGYPFHRTVSHVADREHAGHAGLEQKRRPLERPPFGQSSISQKILPGSYEALLVAFDLPGQPIRVGLGSDEEWRGLRKLRIPQRPVPRVLPR